MKETDRIKSEEEICVLDDQKNDIDPIQLRTKQNIETLNDYSCLLCDFLEELGDDHGIVDNDEETICKADVMFFAKELQWRFDEIKNQFMLNVMKKEKQTNLKEDTNKTHEHDNNNPKNPNHYPKDIRKSSEMTTNNDNVTNCGNDEPKTKPLLPIQARILYGQINQLQKELVEKDEIIDNLKVSSESLQHEMAQMKDREETQRLQILHSQSRLKYLEIAVNTNIRQQRQYQGKCPTDNVNNDIQNQKHFSSHLETSSSKFINAVATASIIQERSNSQQTTSDVNARNNESHKNEEKSYDYDSELPIIEEMRKQIITLAECLEKSEREKVDLLERSKQEKDEYAKWFQSMGEQVKLAILNSEYPIAFKDENHDLD